MDKSGSKEDLLIYENVTGNPRLPKEVEVFLDGKYSDLEAFKAAALRREPPTQDFVLIAGMYQGRVWRFS